MSEILLTTDRLFLRGLPPQEIHDLFRQHSREIIKSRLGLDEQGLALYEQMHQQGMQTFRISQLPFLLIEKCSGQPIGECGYSNWNARHRRAEVFYALRGESFKRKGFMTEALPVIIRYGFEQLQLHRITALVASDNLPSLKLLQKQRFLFEGTMREDYVVNGVSESSDCYSLLQQEWAARAG